MPVGLHIGKWRPAFNMNTVNQGCAAAKDCWAMRYLGSSGCAYRCSTGGGGFNADSACSGVPPSAQAAEISRAARPHISKR